MQKNCLILTVMALLLAGAAFGQPASPAGEVEMESWGVAITLPEGWSVAQKTESVLVLGREGLRGAIVVIPHEKLLMEQVRAQMSDCISDDNGRVAPKGPHEMISEAIAAGDFEGEYDGLHVMARCAGTLSPHGGGVFVIASARPENFTPALSALADSVARKLRYFKVDYAPLARFFCGEWATGSGDAAGTLTLSPDGACSASGAAAVATRSAGSAGGGTVARKWTARGNRFRGALLFTDDEGGQALVEYRVRTEKGMVYWNEYRIGGALFSRKQ